MTDLPDLDLEDGPLYRYGRKSKKAEIAQLRAERDAALERVEEWEVGLGAPDFQTVRANLNNAQHQSGQHALARIEAQLASAQAVIDAARWLRSTPEYQAEAIARFEAALTAHLDRFPSTERN